VVQNLLNNGAKLSRGGRGISEKEGPEATASLSFPNIHPWACNLSCWQSACDWNEIEFVFFPLELQIPQANYCIF